MVLLLHDSSRGSILLQHINILTLLLIFKYIFRNVEVFFDQYDQYSSGFSREVIYVRCVNLS